jgi:hypothetical protein
MQIYGFSALYGINFMLIFDKRYMLDKNIAMGVYYELISVIYIRTQKKRPLLIKVFCPASRTSLPVKRRGLVVLWYAHKFKFISATTALCDLRFCWSGRAGCQEKFLFLLYENNVCLHFGVF